MNRRYFLQAGLLGSAGIVLASNTLFSKKSVRKIDYNIDFSILSDEPEKATDLADSFIKSLSSPQTFVYEENKMNGIFAGDIAWIFDNRLIDFRKSNDMLSKRLRNISELLKLPRNIQNPVLISIRSSNKDIKPKFVNLFRNDTLFERILISENHKSVTIKGTKGDLSFSLENGYLRAIDSSCKHKTCIHTGSISHSGKSIICIPNNLRLTLDGGSKSKVDGITF